MWTQIVSTLVILVLATYIIQLFVPRARGNPNLRRTSMHGDVAPMIGFFGVIVIALSFAEALRQTVLESWALGIGCGLIGGIVFWIGLAYLPTMPIQNNRSALIATFRFLRSYGILIILVVIGAYLAVRFIGATVGVFLAGAAGIVLIAIALKIYIDAKPIPTHRG